LRLGSRSRRSPVHCGHLTQIHPRGACLSAAAPLPAGPFGAANPDRARRGPEPAPRVRA
jgi:hypothetical protein